MITLQSLKAFQASKKKAGDAVVSKHQEKRGSATLTIINATYSHVFASILRLATKN